MLKAIVLALLGMPLPLGVSFLAFHGDPDTTNKETKEIVHNYTPSQIPLLDDYPITIQDDDKS